MTWKHNSDDLSDDIIRWQYCPIESIHPIIQFNLNAETPVNPAPLSSI